MYLSFEKGMRGGVSYISKKYSQANNKYFKSSDQKQESKHIVYLDANNLYHNTMSKIFPTGEFKWIDPKSFDNINSSKGCIPKVGFEHSHKNGKIAWKHGPYNALRSVMLHFDECLLSKGVRNNRNGFRQGRFSL